jgi:heme A synthase
MTSLHSIIGVLVIAVNGLAFVAGGLYLWRRREPHRVYAHVLALGQVLLVAQAAIGLILLSEDLRAPDRLHYLYGALALGAVLSPWVYAPAEPRKRLAWFVGASILAAALAVRAYLTGS